MCGRITLRRPERVKLERLDTRPLFQELPRYNIAPTQNVWAVTESNEERSLSLLQWSLVPNWSKKPAGFINARAETLETKPSFKEAFMQTAMPYPCRWILRVGKVRESKATSLLPDEECSAVFLRRNLGRTGNSTEVRSSPARLSRLLQTSYWQLSMIECR